MDRLAWVLLLIALSLSANAGTSAGKVATIQLANHDRLVIFSMHSEIDEAPRCNELKKFTIDLTRPGGPAMYRGILSAKEHGFVLEVKGLNTCKLHWKSEDVNHIAIQ